jgi:hypothetical protein
MKRKKFRHIHRYAYVLTDIGNTPWVNKEVYEKLNMHNKLVVQRQGYIIPAQKEKSPQQILALLRAGKGIPGGSRTKSGPGKIIKRNPDKGITSISQVPEMCLKRIPFWKKIDLHLSPCQRL